MDESLVNVKINENPVINLEITAYKNEANVNFLQSKGEKGDKGDKGEQGLQGPKGNDGVTPDTNIFVNKFTTINNKALNSNIILTTADINDSADKRYCSDAQKIVISNTSGINTGDETNSTIKSKLGITTLSGSNTGDQDLSGLVAKTTTINNKALNSNITLITSDISEGTNLYYTDARVNSNINVAANTSARHTHNNKTLLDSLITSGDGTKYLASDGTYKTITSSGGNLGYTAENVANKISSLVDADNNAIVFGDDTQYPSAKAVSAALDILVQTLFDIFNPSIQKLDTNKLNKSIYYSNLSAYTLTNGTTAQSIFGKSAVLDANSLYRFRAVYHIGTGATSHTTSHGFYLTSALASCNYVARTISTALNTTSTNINTVFVTGTAAKVLNAASTAVTTIIQLEGTIRTNAATLIQPQITFSAAPGTTCQTYADSFIEFVQIGASSDISFGTWS